MFDAATFFYGCTILITMGLLILIVTKPPEN